MIYHSSSVYACQHFYLPAIGVRQLRKNRIAEVNNCMQDGHIISCKDLSSQLPDRKIITQSGHVYQRSEHHSQKADWPQTWKTQGI